MQLLAAAQAHPSLALQVMHGQQLQASMPLPLPGLQLASQQLASHQMVSQASLWAVQQRWQCLAAKLRPKTCVMQQGAVFFRINLVP